MFMPPYRTSRVPEADTCVSNSRAPYRGSHSPFVRRSAFHYFAHLCVRGLGEVGIPAADAFERAFGYQYANNFVRLTFKLTKRRRWSDWHCNDYSSGPL